MHEDWTGDLADDCRLIRYGMEAHVECLNRGIWWFAIYDARNQLFNLADSEHAVSLTTGKMARAAAECCLEILRRSKQ